MSAAALAVAVERDLSHELLRDVAAGRGPVVVGVRRAVNGVTVELDLGPGDHVERDVVLDGRSFDLRVRLGVLEAVITKIVAETVRQSAAARRAPLNRGSAP